MAKTAKKKAAKKSAKKAASRRRAAKPVLPAGPLAPLVAPGSPDDYRVRIRMYRQGLGDCFLLTFKRRRGVEPFHMLIDCGALSRDNAHMSRFVGHIRDTVLAGETGKKARIDVVVGTHEHRDHLSGFNQARPLWDDDFEFGAVWLSWAENLTVKEIKAVKEFRRSAAKKIANAVVSKRVKSSGQSMVGVTALAGFDAGDSLALADGKDASLSIADALEYLKDRGKAAKALRYLEPGMEPFALDDGVDDVRVFVLGPPNNPALLKETRVTQKMKDEDVVYHLGGTGEVGMDALTAALGDDSAQTNSGQTDGDRYHPFAREHRVPRTVREPGADKLVANPEFASIGRFVRDTYDNARESWRRIDDEWLRAFGQLALDLDNDTNNTSLVLAFEFVKTREVLLFVGDAQVGNWRSWGDVNFKLASDSQPMPAHDLLRRTAFYKVGHHASHNATMKRNGLELMTREDLVAFIPLDRATARSHGWSMPARALFNALNDHAGKRVVLSDAKDDLSAEAVKAGVIATNAYVDYFLT